MPWRITGRKRLSDAIVDLAFRVRALVRLLGDQPEEVLELAPSVALSHGEEARQPRLAVLIVDAYHEIFRMQI